MSARLSYGLLRLVIHGGLVVIFRLRAFGREHVPRKGRLILASNHQSFLDPLFVAAPIPRETHFMARDSLFQPRWFGALIRYFNAFPVRRSSADVSAMKETLRRLNADACVTVFPEATRTSDGRIAPCQGGIISMALKTRSPIVPVAIEGAFDSWPRDRKFPRPTRIWLEYGLPIPPERLDELSNTEGAAVLTTTLRNLHNDLRKRMNRLAIDYDDGAP